MSGRVNVVDRLTYANVVATVALFIALGGASYAAFELPANSVGERQLKFPLGMAATTGSTTSLPVYACPPGAPCAAVIPKPLATINVTLKQSGQMLVYGSASFAEPGTSATSHPVDVSIGAQIGGDANLEEYEIPSAPAPLRVWRMVSASAGRQTIRLEAEALAGGSTFPSSVRVFSPQLAVVALPRIP